MKLETKCLIVGAALTVIWMLVCPKYTIEGDNPTVATYQSRVKAWKTEHRDGRTVQTRTTKLINDDFKHLSTEHFWGGEITIWALLLGLYLSRKETKVE